MADDRSRAERWVGFVAGIVAPVTLLSALLFYFGYVSSRSQYEYFGIDVDTIGLSTRDYVMRSPQPLLVPLLVLTLLGAAAFALHGLVRRRLATPDADQAASTRRLLAATRVAAAALLALGFAALLGYPLLGGVAYFALATPLLLGLGAALLAYTSYVLRPARPPGVRPPTYEAVVRVLLAVVATTCAFWATATMAQYSGRGLARETARHLDRYPVVLLDTRERLYLRSPGVQETGLPAATGQTFRYRYRGLRLLVVGERRMFLVPAQWNASDTTLVAPLDGSVRVQFQFQNDPP